MKLRMPHSFYNIVSYSGAVIAMVATFMFLFLFVLDSIAPTEKAYLGIVIFIVIPAFLILGLLLIPLGMFWQARKQKKSGTAIPAGMPVLDLNISSHRTGTVIFVIGSVIFLFLSALGSYEAYHYTESTLFCGTLCHKLMIPEYTAYQHSPHARVRCAECHVGEGANWYVKSKLSGLYQVYATLTRTYPKPIPTPIKNLRPARETCERCHWPQKIYGKQQRREIYHRSDEHNTRWEIDLLMNTGSGNPAMGLSSGIHWHINPDIELAYIAADEQRASIPQITLRNKSTGETVVYTSTVEPLVDSLKNRGQERIMDCIDCHNRPSHIYNDPGRFINHAMVAGEIDANLPLIKKAAVEACIEKYESDDQAASRLPTLLEHFYMENAQEVWKQRRAEVNRAIQGVEKAFQRNIFPEMKVRWDEYPNHIGHLTSPGCFRCHDDQHVSSSGKVISRRCENCHQIMNQGPTGRLTYSSSAASLEFEHPVDIGDAWKEGQCSECHSSPPSAE